MISDSNHYSKLSKNIKDLRKAYGETQLQLILALGVKGCSPATISQYETGDRIPERDILLKIAKHYLITENELLNGDFSDLKIDMNAPVGEREYADLVCRKFIPLIESEEALNNKDFNKAYEMHKAIYQSILDGIEYNQADLEQCLSLYEKANDAGIVEGTANSLWWIMFFGFLLSFMNSELYEKVEDFQENRISLKELLQKAILPSFYEEDFEYEPDQIDEFENARKEFLEENEVDMLVKIYILKHSERYQELGDYYLAFRYLFGLSSTGISKEMNRTIGLEMLYAFSLMGNKYAKVAKSNIEEK